MNSCMTEDEMQNSIIEEMKTVGSEKFKWITYGEITRVINDYLTDISYKNMSEGEWGEYYLLESIYEIEKLLEEKKINKHKSVAVISTFNKTIPQYLIELLNEAKNDLEETNK